MTPDFQWNMMLAFSAPLLLPSSFSTEADIVRIRCPLHMESDRGGCFPDDLRIIKGAIMMAIILLGCLLFCVFVPSLNRVTA